MLGKKTSNRGRNPLVWLVPQDYLSALFDMKLQFVCDKICLLIVYPSDNSTHACSWPPQRRRRSSSRTLRSQSCCGHRSRRTRRARTNLQPKGPTSSKSTLTSVICKMVRYTGICDLTSEIGILKGI